MRRQAHRPSLPRWPASALGILSTLAALLPGCGEVIPEGLADGDAALDVSATELYRVGALDGEEWETFARIARVRFDGEGRLYILDPGRHSVVVLSPEGEYLRTVGTRGEGPGELRSPTTLEVMEDGTIVIGDMGARAYVLYASDGSYLRSVPLTDADGFPSPSSLFHPSGGIVTWGISLTFGPGQQPSFPTEVPIRLTSLDGSGTATLAEAWVPPRNLDLPVIRAPAGGGSVQMRIAVGGGGGGPALTGFEPRIHTAVLPDGRVAVVDSTLYRIAVYDPTGSTGDTFERSIRPQLVGEVEQRLERERRLADLASGATAPPTMLMMGGGGATLTGPNEEEWRRSQEERIATMEFWDEIPVIQALASDVEGRLWVERSALPGEEGPVDLLSSGGSYLGSIPPGSVRIPAAFGPNGLAAYIEEDELEIPFVRVVRLTGLP